MLVTDFVNDGYKQVRAVNIVTTKPEELSGAIMDKLARGCTCLQVKGMHSKSDRYQLVCLVSKYQIGQLKSIIKEIDSEAFVYLTKVSEVVGIWSSVEEIQKETEGKDKKEKPKKKSKTKEGKVQVQETNSAENVLPEENQQETISRQNEQENIPEENGGEDK